MAVAKRVGLEKHDTKYTYEDVVCSNNIQHFSKDIELFWNALSSAVREAFPQDTMIMGTMNVGGDSVEQLLIRVGQRFMGSPLRILYFPHSGRNDDVSLICTSRLFSGDKPVKVDNLFTTLLNTDPKLKAMYDASREPTDQI